MIKVIRDATGSWQVDVARDEVTLNYFHTLFTASTKRGCLQFLDNLVGKVTNEMKQKLQMDFVTA